MQLQINLKINIVNNMLVNLLLQNNQVSVGMLLTDLEDHKDKLHVINGAMSKILRKIIIDDDELSVADTNKVKK